MSRPNRKLAAIVFTDIVGFTELSGKNEPAALKLLEKQREIIKPIVDKYNGEWLKEIGDGLLLAFETIHDAVECSITIQGSTKAISDLDLRIGIHQGEVVYQNDDVVGDDGVVTRPTCSLQFPRSLTMMSLTFLPMLVDSPTLTIVSCQRWS